MFIRFLEAAVSVTMRAVLLFFIMLGSSVVSVYAVVAAAYIFGVRL